MQFFPGAAHFLRATCCPSHLGSCWELCLFKPATAARELTATITPCVFPFFCTSSKSVWQIRNYSKFRHTTLLGIFPIFSPLVEPLEKNNLFMSLISSIGFWSPGYKLSRPTAVMIKSMSMSAAGDHTEFFQNVCVIMETGMQQTLWIATVLLTPHLLML